MTKYEYLILMKDELEKKAREIEDLELKIFYSRASKGFEMKIKKMKVSEAKKEIILLRR